MATIPLLLLVVQFARKSLFLDLSIMAFYLFLASSFMINKTLFWPNVSANREAKGYLVPNQPNSTYRGEPEANDDLRTAWKRIKPNIEYSCFLSFCQFLWWTLSSFSLKNLLLKYLIILLTDFWWCPRRKQ